MSEQTTSPATTDFAIGDKVTWTHMTSSGNSFRFSVRSGTVVMRNNNQLQVKARNGRLHWISIKTDGVRKEGQRNAITEALLGPE